MAQSYPERVKLAGEKIAQIRTQLGMTNEDIARGLSEYAKTKTGMGHSMLKRNKLTNIPVSANMPENVAKVLRVMNAPREMKEMMEVGIVYSKALKDLIKWVRLGDLENKQFNFAQFCLDYHTQLLDLPNFSTILGWNEKPLQTVGQDLMSSLCYIFMEKALKEYPDDFSRYRAAEDILKSPSSSPQMKKFIPEMRICLERFAHAKVSIIRELMDREPAFRDVMRELKELNNILFDVCEAMPQAQQKQETPQETLAREKALEEKQRRKNLACIGRGKSVDAAEEPPPSPVVVSLPNYVVGRKARAHVKKFLHGEEMDTLPPLHELAESFRERSPQDQQQALLAAIAESITGQPNMLPEDMRERAKVLGNDRSFELLGNTLSQMTAETPNAPMLLFRGCEMAGCGLPLLVAGCRPAELRNTLRTMMALGATEVSEAREDMLARLEKMRLSCADLLYRPDTREAQGR